MSGLERLLVANKPNQVARGLCALAIMTKAPRPGAVKTRLQPPLTAEEAASLNISFLQDTAATIIKACASQGRNGCAVAVYTPLGEEDIYQRILPQEFRLLIQRGHGFDERLTNAAADLLTAGFASCCLIDSDSPTVTAEAFCEAIDVLREKENRVVLGPSDDGGYYLIGMKKLHRQLFERIDWSTERVFEQTVTRAQENGLEVHTLPAFFDIDDAASLNRLCNELLTQNRDSAPATKNFLQQMMARDRDRFLVI